MNKKIIYIVLAVLAVALLWFIIPRNKGNSTAEDQGAQAPERGAQELYEKARAYYTNGKLLNAKEYYKRIVTDFANYEKIDVVQKELEDINIQIIFSSIPTEYTLLHEVQSGDTLGKLAKQYGTTIDLIKAGNHLQSNIIRIGQKLRIWKGMFNILVDKSQNILILKDEAEVIKVYDVSTGEEASTPVGSFTITSRLIDPVWFNKGIALPPGSPQNVLGTRWLGFDMPGYGIHGTIDPGSIGKHVTAGCVRMRNSDVEELYNIVPIGTQVVIMN